jgi:lipoyl(octanoyl) transferase
MNDRQLIVCDLGRMSYAEAWDLQKRIQQRLITAKRQDPVESLPHVLLLVEHPPVYTLGKSGDASNLLLSEQELDERNLEYFEIGRGGDITFHGPGQLVVYPILDLDRFFTDLGRYLRTLEAVILDLCSDFGLKADRIAGRTGVWIGPDEKGPERKICAMGIRCSRWVTLHGLAFNINTDLSYFSNIIPCGIKDRGVTSLAQELGRPIDDGVVKHQFIDYFIRHFETPFDIVPSSTLINSNHLGRPNSG